uniref:Phosphatidylglycerophosphatase and protein-tyrosine phosphatase 1 n=1 Tax=Strongyloides stercoralis TaxID=6248 RepID=A0A0K0DVJ6_STRER
MFSYIAFYPSLAFNIAKNYIQPQKWAWFNRIDDGLIVGALPFKSMVDDLKKENVGGVVCCTEPFEMAITYNSMDSEDWAKENIKFYHIPMTDFFGSTSRANVLGAISFMEEINNEGKSVYVHCKAGRTRSATIAMCYLLKKYNYMPNIALEFLKKKRPQVILRSAHWRTVTEYRRYLDTQPRSSLN